MSKPDAAPKSRRKYWILFGAVPLAAALLLLAFLLFAGAGDKDSFVYTLF